MARIGSAVLVALALTGCSGGEEAGLERADLPRLVLQTEDLGAPFTQFDEGPLRAADRPSGARADPARFGRVDGHIARYRRRGSPATEGPLVVESRVDLFESGDGASSDLDAVRDQASQRSGHATEVVEAELGDESHVVRPRSATPTPGTVRYVTVVWRYRNALATLIASGFELEAGDVLGLARKQQARLERAAP